MGQKYFQYHSSVYITDHIKYRAGLVLSMQFPNGIFQSQNNVAQGWWQLNSKNYLRNKCTLFRCFLCRFGVWKIFSTLPTILTNFVRKQDPNIHISQFLSSITIFFTNRKLDFWESFRTEKRQNMMKFFLSSGVKRLRFEISINLICFKPSYSMSKNFHRFTKAWFKNFTAMILPLILGDGFLWQCVSY